MEKVDLVLVGAEGVVESGGIINKVSNGWYFLLTFYPPKLWLAIAMAFFGYKPLCFFNLNTN